MIKRTYRQMFFNESIAYKNSNLEYVNFTDNFLEKGGFRSEEDLLGKKNYELPWGQFAEGYHAHDIDALAGKVYSAIAPFCGADPNLKTHLICKRTLCKLADGSDGIYMHLHPLYNPYARKLLNVLQKYDPVPSVNYYTGKKVDKVDLTSKELECLFFLLRGKQAKVIADFMRISTRTAEYHINNLKDKFDCRNKSELIAKAIQSGFMSIIPETIAAKDMLEALKT